MDSKRFVELVTDALMEENERRVGDDKHLLDVAFMVAPIEQHISDTAYADMLTSLDEGCGMHYRDDADGYTNGALFIVPEGVGRYYSLTFTYDERMWGYCMCKPDNEWYDGKRLCCGNGCDWTAPAFSIEKVETVGVGKWEGAESDYWRYEETTNARLAERNADVERERKERQAEYLRGEIERLTQQLSEVEG